MGLFKNVTKMFKNVAHPKEAIEENREVVDDLVREKLNEARKVADSFVGHKVEELKSEAWAMVDELERRMDVKLDDLERRLDERLQRELYWKLVGLRWTLFFVLLATLVGIGYTLAQRYLF